MTARPALYRTPLLPLLLALAACDDEASPPRPPGPGLDDDASIAPPEDAGSPDADAGEEPDAGPEPRGCRETAPRFSAPFQPNGRGFDLAVDALDVHLVYVDTTCAGAGDALGHQLRYVRFATTGEVPEPAALPVVSSDRCAKIRDPLLTLEPGDTPKPIVHFLSTRELAWEAYRLAADEPEVDITRLSDPATDHETSQLVGTRDPGGAALVAWLEDSDDSTAIVTHGRNGLRTWVESSQGLQIGALALGWAGSGTSAQPLLAYTAAPSVLRVQPINGEGALVGEPHMLDAQLSAAPAVVLGGSEEGGAIVYTEGAAGSEELRFRALALDGTASGNEQKLTTAAERARSPSIASFVTGFVIAFRAVLADRPDRAMLRLAFLDSLGNVSGFRDVVETSAAGGPIVLRIAVDGRLVLGFAEVDGEGASTLHVARATCTSG